MSESKRLGKGLDAIFGDGLSDVLEDIQQGTLEYSQGRRVDIELNQIRPNPYQPRKAFDEEKINELAQSILEHGVFTPVLVRESLQGYELIAGERRVRASEVAGQTTIPAIIMEFDDNAMMEISLLENIQREGLNAIEEANGYQQMIDKLNYTQEQLAKRIGKSREHVSNLLRLRRLPEKIQNMLIDNKLSMGHVRPLVTIDDEDVAIYFANRIIDEGLSVRAVERLIKEGEQVTKRTPEKERNRDLDNVRAIIEKKLQTKVKLDEKQIVIRYNGVSDLNRILEILDLLEEEN